MKNLIIKTSVLFLFICLNIQSQVVPFDSGKWTIDAKVNKIETHLGKKCLKLQGGIAYLTNSKFLNGIIEFDISFSGERGFMGVIWRMQDKENYEEFYLRPHLSGKPDANQYNPVYNGLAGWQLYFGKEYSAPVNYKNNSWTHVKIAVNDKNAEVYIDDMDKPALFVNELKRKEETGKVGLTVANFVPAYYANFSYTPMKHVELKGKAVSIKPAELGTVMSWIVSNTFDEKSLDKQFALPKDFTGNLNWTKLETEKSGLANLAVLSGTAKGHNTVFAKLLINSDKEQIKRINFGYSDRVKVYVNGRILYSGNNNYMSRDYRYLGTIGYFDTVYLPLKKGQNEILFAVSEDFGGWGIQARFEDTKGIKIL